MQHLTLHGRMIIRVRDILKSALFRRETRFYTSRTRGSLGAREFSTNDRDSARTGARSLPTHAESSFFFFFLFLPENFEVKQSSIKKERVFHTQECKMLHNSTEILILCIRISKFYNYWSLQVPSYKSRVPGC